MKLPLSPYIYVYPSTGIIIFVYVGESFLKGNDDDVDDDDDGDDGDDDRYMHLKVILDQ